MPSSTNPALILDQDPPIAPNLQKAQFAAGCFWGVELAFQHVPGVVKTEVGYTQGHLPEPTYPLVQNGDTGHAEAVRIHFDPNVCSYQQLLQIFWTKHDPTSVNRQGEDEGDQYRSGIYYYNEGQERMARESLEAKEKEMEKKIVTEILPARTFYRAEEYHQQYLEKQGGAACSSPTACSLKQSAAAKQCSNPMQCSIRCYG